MLFNGFNLRVSVLGRVFPTSISGINGLSISATAFTRDFSIENMEPGLYVSMICLSGSTLIPVRSPKPHSLSLWERGTKGEIGGFPLWALGKGLLIFTLALPAGLPLEGDKLLPNP